MKKKKCLKKITAANVNDVHNVEERAKQNVVFTCPYL